MIIDAQDPAAGIPGAADVCIIGAGAAGIALALELGSRGRRVLLVEAGGTRFDATSQRLFEGEATGDPFPPLRDTRLGALGGTTEVWAGHCRPLEARDFGGSDGRVGWPFGPEALDPWYRRAQAFLGLTVLDFDTDAWASRLRLDPILRDDAVVRTWIFQISALRAGRHYRGQLEASRDIEVLLHAPVLRLHLAESGTRVERAAVRTLRGRGFDLRARCFVLAAGGIENARLLLLSADVPAQAPGNARGLVGRFFTDHAFADPGYLEAAGHGLRLDGYLPQRAAHGAGTCSIRGALTLDPAVLDREQLQNGALLFYPRYASHEVFATREVREFLEAIAKLTGKAVPGGSGTHLARALRAPRHVAVAILRKLVVANGPARRWWLRAMFETESRFDNRVTLGSQCDTLGRPCARIEWRLSDRDIHSMRRFMSLMDDAFRRHRLGRIVPAFTDDDASWRAAIIGGKHHMGTTRMHRDPVLGVVDENARVHGTTNLFVAGSSVFPAGGLVNPTLTLVALALRLADHIDRAGRERFT